MTKHSKGSTNTVARDKLVIRFLIDDPRTGWRVLPMVCALRAYRGDCPLPELADRVVRIASAYVIKRDGKAAELVRVELSTLTMDAEGCVDQSALMREIQRKMEPNHANGHGDAASSARDIADIARCLSVALPAESSGC